jgi:hypothetical protein
VQGVAREAVVERVAGDVGSRLEPPRQRERAGLAGAGLGQQPLLDLGRQAQRPAPLSPLVEVGVAAVGDHDEREQVCQRRDLGEVVLAGFGGRPELQQPDDLAALGDGREHGPAVVLDVGLRRDDLQLLSPDDALHRTAVERDQPG